MLSMVQFVNGDITKYVAHNSGRRSLIEAVESGSRAGVISALVRGENIEQTDDHGHTALVIALNEGHVELAKLLVEKGAFSLLSIKQATAWYPDLFGKYSLNIS